MIRFVLPLALTLIAAPVLSQSFTTAAEVRPILGATKSNWVAVREYDGNDLVYFTGVLSWRCGLDSIHFGLNGEPPETPFEMEPCHEDTAFPNAIAGEGGLEIYFRQPLGSVEAVSVRITYDDGGTEEGSWERAAILMP